MEAPDVLILSPHLAPPAGGIQRLAVNVADALADRSVRVVGVSAARSADPRIRVARSTAGYVVAAIAEVRRGPRVVHAMTWRAALPALLVPGRPPVVLYCMGGELIRASGARLRRFVLRRVDAVLAISAFTAGLVREVAGREAPVIAPPVTAVPADVAPRPARDHVRLLSVGRLVKNKGHDRLLRAVADVRAHGVPLTVTIVGAGPEEAALRALVDELGLAGVAQLAGERTDEELDALYRDADLFALLSRPVAGEVEGFGIVFLEANAYRLPVVAGRSGGSVEAVADGVSGIVVDDDAGAMEALTRLATDASLRVAMGNAGHDRLTQFSLAAFGDQLRAFYATL